MENLFIQFKQSHLAMVKHIEEYGNRYCDTIDHIRKLGLNIKDAYNTEGIDFHLFGNVCHNVDRCVFNFENLENDLILVFNYDGKERAVTFESSFFNITKDTQEDYFAKMEDKISTNVKNYKEALIKEQEAKETKRKEQEERTRLYNLKQFISLSEKLDIPVSKDVYAAVENI